ncbi:unnamed protein product [Schistosoma margrebowiei]|uniref:Uncharacterized protein n=1 Tax=Schistosoma margrebowiei TaxID=48269 RepID=A0A183M4M7_9TREM|nr:unnamed protein product [Schistosoma margrebowiei]
MVAGDQQLVHTPFVHLGYWSSCAPLLHRPAICIQTICKRIFHKNPNVSIRSITSLQRIPSIKLIDIFEKWSIEFKNDSELALIKETGINKSSVSQTIWEKDDTLICSQSRRLERWAEHFREQFSWPSATLQLLSIPRQCEWNIEVGPSTLVGFQKPIVNLKRGRAAGPDGLAPEVVKHGPSRQHVAQLQAKEEEDLAQGK